PFLVMLSNAPFGRAHAGDRIQTGLTSLTTDVNGDSFVIPGIPSKRVNGRNALKLKLPPPSLSNLLTDTAQVFAHELGHSFGLGDEYVEFAEEYKGDENSLAAYGNLTTKGAVLKSDGSVRFDQIKWNWQRIRKASVITLKIGTRPLPDNKREFLV